MVRVERTLTTNRPLDVVVEYLKDFAHAEQWDPGTRSCERIDDGPITIGSRWRNISVFRGKETELTYELTHADQQRLTFVGRNKTATSTDDMTFDSAGHTTSITYHATIEFHGLAKLADPLLKREFEKLGDTTVDTLTRALHKLPVE